MFTEFGPVGNFYEAPRWHEGSWWVSDFYAHRVLRIDTEGSAATVVEVDGQPGGAWLVARRDSPRGVDARPAGSPLGRWTSDRVCRPRSSVQRLGKRHVRHVRWLRVRKQLRVRPLRPSRGDKSNVRSCRGAWWRGSHRR